MKPKRFPKTLFVRIEKDGKGEYLVAEDAAVRLAVIGAKVTIATYQLVEVSEVVGVAQFKKLRNTTGLTR